MKTRNVLTSGRIELPGEEQVYDYSMSQEIYQGAVRYRKRERRLAEKKLERAMKESGWEFEF